MASDKGCCEHSRIATTSVYQTLTEMDFERGIWNAALNGEYNRVKKMLDDGVNPSLPDNQGFTALHYAARNGKLGICTLLLEKGADVNAKTHGGATPLHRAAFLGYTEIVIMLLEHGADPEIRDSDGKTSLHKAVEGSFFEIGRLLLEQSPQLIHIKDNKGNLPEFYVKPSHKELYNVLLGLGD